jgi:hypothetical protein
MVIEILPLERKGGKLKVAMLSPKNTAARRLLLELEGYKVNSKAEKGD